MSFVDFDRCLDSLAVLSGRVVHKLKSKRKFRVRVCRYGGTIRKPWRTRQREDSDVDGDSMGDDPPDYQLQGPHEQLDACLDNSTRRDATTIRREATTSRRDAATSGLHSGAIYVQ